MDRILPISEKPKPEIKKRIRSAENAITALDKIKCYQISQTDKNA